MLPAPSAWRIFVRNRAAAVAAVILAVLVAFALLVPAYKRKLAALWPGVRTNPSVAVKEAK